MFVFFMVSLLLTTNQHSKMTEKKRKAKAYIEHLSKGELQALLALFSKDAIVHSPVYGSKNYKDFYEELFNDTNNSTLEVKGIFEDNDSGHIALYFTYQWTLRDDKDIRFDVVDILEFDSDTNIHALTIIYDTVESRVAVDLLNKNR